MTLIDWLPLVAVASALVPGVVITFLPEERSRLRTRVNLVGATLQLVVVAILIGEVAAGKRPEVRLPFVIGQEIVLHSDALSLLLAGLSAVLWFLTTLYAIGYLEHSPNRNRFFGFFSLCVSATLGIALAGNLFTFFVFYELLTLATYPLVVHRGTPDARRAGRIYLGYTLPGGLAFLIGLAWLVHVLEGPVGFTPGGVIPPGVAPDAVLLGIFALLVGGMAVKAAMVPLHGWLPIAMVAPAPVSALLHAVAVVKAGAFGVVRVILDVFGLDLALALGGAQAVAALAAVTIIYGSLRALFQDHLKRRLAFSTVSQVSYILLGTALGGSIALAGGLVHLVHQGLMKITLFFCAGIYAETRGIHYISEMAGIGRRMPWTTAAFTVGALGMIGAPPIAGFITKWYLGLGGLAIGEGWVVAVLVTSSLLNAAYFLPILYTAWFQEWAGAPEPIEAAGGPAWRGEAPGLLLGPPLVTAVLALGLGLLADMPYTALQWVRLITERELGLWVP